MHGIDNESLLSPFVSFCSVPFGLVSFAVFVVAVVLNRERNQAQILMIGTSGINVANCYKQYGSTVDALRVSRYR